MLQKTFVTTTLGNPITLALRHGAYLAEKINGLEPAFEKHTHIQLKSCTQQFRERFSRGETIDDLLVEAFATVRETSKRSLGMRHYDAQLIGGVLFHQGKITEMRTGEGKTLMPTLPLYLNALCGRGAYLITANDYLVRRDARWMSPIFSALGMSVGVLQLNTLDPSTPIGYLVDPSVETSFEATRHLKMEGRSVAYSADVTYGTFSEFGFDYLRDNLAMKIFERVSREHVFSILDEVDNILIDEARTPLIIFGASGENGTCYVKMARVVRSLHASDVDIDEKNKTVSLTDTGVFRVEGALGFALRNPETPELITPEQDHISTFLEQALRAQFLYRSGADLETELGRVQDLSAPDPVVLRAMLSPMAWANSAPGQSSAIRLNYFYLVADILIAQNAALVQKRVIDHLNGALAVLYRSYGQMQLGALMEQNFSIDNLLPAVRSFGSMGFAVVGVGFMPTRAGRPPGSPLRLAIYYGNSQRAALLSLMSSRNTLRLRLPVFFSRISIHLHYALLSWPWESGR